MIVPKRIPRLPFLVVAALLVSASAASSQTPPLTASNLARLDRSGGPLPAGHGVAVRYEGTLTLEAHLSRPHEVHEYHSLRRIAVTAPGVARQDWTTWSDADTTRSTETTLLVGDRVLQRTDASAPWIELAGREAYEAAYTIRAGAPPLAVARIRGGDGHGLSGGAVSPYQSTYVWTDSLGRSEWTMDALDLPASFTVLRSDPRRGSVVQDTHVLGASTVDGRIWPDSLRTPGNPADVSWMLTEHRVAIENAVPMSEFTVPAQVTPPPPAADTTARLARLAPGVWAVELPDADTRSLAVEFSDHLVLLETSSDGVRGERLRGVLRAHFPKKPVRFVSFSHHHPDYTGGLRPFLADSAEVVCAGAIAPFVTEITNLNFSVWPDRLWNLHPSGFPPRIDSLVAGRWRHADATNELVAIDIGAQSHHTEHYLVFWLPRQKLLFEGDLGFFTTDGVLRASRRAEGLLQAVDAAKLAPETVVQSWPVKGNPASVPMVTLRALVAARAKP